VEVVGDVGDAAEADPAPVDAAADGVNAGLRPLLTADVPFSAEAAESAEVAESADSASGAASVCWLVSQLLSPELIVRRLPCRSLPRPLAPADPDESADRPFALPIVSAGSGTAVLDPASVLSPSAVSADASSTEVVATSPEVAVSPESSEVVVSPEAEESPLALPDRRDAPERELPVLVRDDDMMPLSTIVSEASPSGSTFRLGGAMMSGG
jgi:hypothetical protein